MIVVERDDLAFRLGCQIADRAVKYFVSWPARHVSSSGEDRLIVVVVIVDIAVRHYVHRTRVGDLGPVIELHLVVDLLILGRVLARRMPLKYLLLLLLVELAHQACLVVFLVGESGAEAGWDYIRAERVLSGLILAVIVFSMLLATVIGVLQMRCIRMVMTDHDGTARQLLHRLLLTLLQRLAFGLLGAHWRELDRFLPRGRLGLVLPGVILRSALKSGFGLGTSRAPNEVAVLFRAAQYILRCNACGLSLSNRILVSIGKLARCR